MKKSNRPLIVLFCLIGMSGIVSLLLLLVSPWASLIFFLALTIFWVTIYSFLMISKKKLDEANKEFEEAMEKEGTKVFKVPVEKIKEMEKTGVTTLDTGTPLFRDEVKSWQLKTNQK